MINPNLGRVFPGDSVRTEPINSLVDIAIAERSPNAPGVHRTPVGTVSLRPPGAVAGLASVGFALITSRIGLEPPYIYSAAEAEMDSTGAWSEAAEAATYENVFNVEEQGQGGQWVNPILVGDVVTIFAAPGGADAYVCQRAHYRGTY